MQCHNIFNLKSETSSVGSKRERSTDDETVSTIDLENKENNDEVVPCTPKKQWSVNIIYLFNFECQSNNINVFFPFQH